MSDSYTVLGYKCLFQVSWLHRTVPGCILIYCYVLPRSKHMLTLICDRRQLQSSLPQSPELFKSVTWHLRSVMYNDYFMICMQKSVLHFVCLFVFVHLQCCYNYSEFKHYLLLWFPHYAIFNKQYYSFWLTVLFIYPNIQMFKVDSTP